MTATTKKNAHLRQAVHQHAPWRIRGLGERMFTAWFGGFFYNQIWEDPRVDMAALELTPESRILTISSAGCNVLNYLTQEPGHILAVDLNPHHIFLTKLKLAALKHLPDYESFFWFFGCSDLSINRENYERYIRQHLDDETRAFWEGGSWLRRKFKGPRINYFTKNLYNHARLGYFIRFLHGLAKISRTDPTRILRAKSKEEQEAIFEEIVGPVFRNPLARAIGKMPFLLFGLGIPPRQVEALREETGGQLMEVYRERIRRLACAYPIEDNYFTWQAFGRTYDRANRQALPPYLKEENYETIKGCVDHAETRITTTVDAMKGMEPGARDRFIFLDSQDWMKPEEITGQWSEIARIGKPGSRIIFRTASSKSPIEESLPPELMARFDYQGERSRELHAQDRSAIYGGFHLYVLKG